MTALIVVGVLATGISAVAAMNPGGDSWILAVSAASPHARYEHALAYDSARGRVVLFGGNQATSGSQLFHDTWEWDGSKWQERKFATRPTLFGHAMAYDSARGRVVMFGASSVGPVVGQTWEWDGYDWIRRTPATSPPGMWRHAMAYDSARARTVLFGFYGTWEWDGNNWIQRTPATSPSIREDHAMAYDSARGRVVLTCALQSALVQTWEWDGNNWILRAPATSPAGRSRHAMAYDAARGRVVLFGGLWSTTLSDTWEWDGNNWIQRTTGASPPGRFAHEMAYDVARGRVVLFAGEYDDGNAGFGDTWEWDGSAWVERTPTTGPSNRWTRMAYDVSRKRAVLFGDMEVADTWEWDGTWARRSPIHRPPPRDTHDMTYDGARGRVVLFGGYVDTATWEWDGNDWIERAPAHTPSTREYHAMTYDSARRRVVLFGGGSWNNGQVVGHSDTWEWDGNDWVERTPALSPPARYGHFLAYDSARARVVLFGGYSGFTSFTDTWEWDGDSWVERTPATSSPTRFGQAMAYDSGRGRVVLLARASIDAQFADTWEWDGMTWTKRSLAIGPPAGMGPAMVYDGARGRLVLFGGGAPPDGWLFHGETWEYGSIACAHASDVVSFAPGSGASGTAAFDALGPPDGVAASLGTGGSLTLEFDPAIPDGPGADLIVHEIGSTDGALDDSYRVDVSEDGIVYRYAGECPGDDCQLDIGGSGLTSARYVRLADLLPEEGEPAPRAGADIDGLSVVACDACELLESAPDGDGDGLANVCDDCPEHADPTQIDLDGDGAGDACDCAPADPLVHPAAEVEGLSVETLGAGALRLSWSPGAGAGTYAVIRGELSAISVSLGDCVAGGLAAMLWEDTELPPPGDGFAFLVRGESSACGPGPLGFGAAGAPRIYTGGACP